MWRSRVRDCAFLPHARGSSRRHVKDYGLHAGFSHTRGEVPQTLDGTARRVNAYPREFTPYLALALSTSHGVSSIPAEVVDDVIWRPTNVRKYACISMEPDDVFDVYGQIGPRKWEYQESHNPDDLALGIRGWAIPRPWSDRLRDGLLHPLVLAERDRVAGLGDRATRVEQWWLEKHFGWWLETGEDCPE